LDCKEEGCQKFKEEAPQILDYLDEACKKHFMKVIEYLDELDLPYVLNSQIVRGLDYYTKTIFEYWSSDDSEGKSALGGGGRYDGLVEMLGGRESTPACGFSLGMDRIVSKLREKEISVPEVYQPEIFVAQLGESAKKKTFVIYEKLRKRGFKVAQAFYKDNLKTQLELANKLKVKFTLILGQKEVGEGTILVRDMEGGIQEVVDFNKIENDVAKRLDKWHQQKLEKFTAPEEGDKPEVRPKGEKRAKDLEDFNDEADNGFEGSYGGDVMFSGDNEDY